MMDLTFKNQMGHTFPHTPESWDETLEVARLYGYEGPGLLDAPQPGQSIPDEEAHGMAAALERAVREDLGEHSVLAEFADLLRGGGVVVEGK